MSGLKTKKYVFKKSYKRLLIGLFDFLGGLGYRLFNLFKKTSPENSIYRILLIRLDHLGDVVMIRPAIRTLAKKFPGLKIDLLITKDLAALFADDPDIHALVPAETSWYDKNSFQQKISEADRLLSILKKNRYDAAIDFRGDLRNIFLMWLARIPKRIGYGITGGDFLLTDTRPYSFTDHQVILNHRLLECLDLFDHSLEQKPFQYNAAQKSKFWHQWGSYFHDIHPRIIIHPGAGYPSKRWPGSKFSELIDKILENEIAQVVLIGTEIERTLLSPSNITSELFVDLRGKTTLHELPIIFDSCDLYLGNDSGPAHIAASQNIPMIVLFSGTNKADIWRPWSKHLHLINYEVPCSPCESKICPLKHHNCMENISVDTVYKLIVETIQKQASK